MYICVFFLPGDETTPFISDTSNVDRRPATSENNSNSQGTSDNNDANRHDRIAQESNNTHADQSAQQLCVGGRPTERTNRPASVLMKPVYAVHVDIEPKQEHLR